MRRLERVSHTVKNNAEKVDLTVDSTREAYGVLFGWAIMPFIKGLANSTGDFATSLHDALDESRAAIKKTHAAYSDQELDAKKASDVVTAAVDEAAGKVVKK